MTPRAASEALARVLVKDAAVPGFRVAALRAPPAVAFQALLVAAAFQVDFRALLAAAFQAPLGAEGDRDSPAGEAAPEVPVDQAVLGDPVARAAYSDQAQRRLLCP